MPLKKDVSVRLDKVTNKLYAIINKEANSLKGLQARKLLYAHQIMLGKNAQHFGEKISWLDEEIAILQFKKFQALANGKNDMKIEYGHFYGLLADMEMIKLLELGVEPDLYLNRPKTWNPPANQ